MKDLDWVDAKTACQRLGVRPQTLYAYVSRGFLRAVSDPQDSRRSLYALLDVDQLAARHRRPRARADVAANAVRWGDPVLHTAISGVRDGVLFFGARPATSCADDMTLEEVAAHHWRVDQIPPARHAGAGPPGSASPLRRCLHVLAAQAADQPAMLGQSRADLAVSGAHLMSLVTNAMLGVRATGLLHDRIADAWGLQGAGRDVLRRALVLMSDHELNPSTFAVRVCASTGASLAAVLLAGMSTLSGPRHGGAGAAARAALVAAGRSHQAACKMVQDGPYMHGFGHPLYPAGDVRAAYLLKTLGAQAPVVRQAQALAKAVDLPPNIDAALAAFGLVYRLPPDAGFVIFALGRLAGWIAHAIEQVESGDLIRPRATFTG